MRGGGDVGASHLTDLGACFSDGLKSLEEALGIATTTCSSRSSPLLRKWC